MPAQLAVLQVERPDVVDVAVARDVGIDRLVRIGRRRREHQRVLIDELRRRIVMRAERQLCLGAGCWIDLLRAVAGHNASPMKQGSRGN